MHIDDRNRKLVPNFSRVLPVTVHLLCPGVRIELIPDTELAISLSKIRKRPEADFSSLDLLERHRQGSCSVRVNRCKAYLAVGWSRHQK